MTRNVTFFTFPTVDNMVESVKDDATENIGTMHFFIPFLSHFRLSWLLRNRVNLDSYTTHHIKRSKGHFFEAQEAHHLASCTHGFQVYLHGPLKKPTN